MAQIVGLILAFIFITAGGIFFGVLLAAWRGYIVQHLWNWLIVPIFALHELTTAQGFAISLVCGVLVGQYGFSKKRDNKEHAVEFFGHVLSGFFALGIAWLVTFFL